MKRQVVLFVAVVSLGLVSVARADITWVVTYNDVNNNTNIGFDDPTFGATRQATVQAVFNYINTVVDENGTAEIRFNNSLNNSGSGVLASAGPFFFNTPGFSNGFLFNHATTGIDPSGSFPDATAQVNFGHNWNSGLGTPASNQFDLFTVLLHEVTHAMGFLSLMNSTGASAIGTNVYSVYDSFLERQNGTRLFPSGPTFVGNSSDLTTGRVFFDGPNTLAFNNGNRSEMYTPNTFSSGSSISHLDGSMHPTAVMNPSVAPGVTKRVYSSQDLGVLADIGWTLNAVPEPGTMAIWTVLGTAAVLVRRRRRKAQQAADAARDEDPVSLAI